MFFFVLVACYAEMSTVPYICKSIFRSSWLRAILDSKKQIIASWDNWWLEMIKSRKAMNGPNSSTPIVFLQPYQDSVTAEPFQLSNHRLKSSEAPTLPGKSPDTTRNTTSKLPILNSLGWSDDLLGHPLDDLHASTSFKYLAIKDDIH